MTAYERRKEKMDIANLFVSTASLGLAAVALSLNEKPLKEEGKTMTRIDPSKYSTKKDLKKAYRTEIKKLAVSEVGYPGTVIVLNGKRNGNKVTYVRHSNDTAVPLVSGRTGIPRKIKTQTVTTKSGDKYEIPVDAKGRVPKEYIYNRFLDVNSGGRDGHVRSVPIDLSKDAVIMHEYPEKGFTPREIVENGWWPHPGESDIYGIDDTSMWGQIQEMIAGSSKAGKAAAGQIILQMGNDSGERVWKVLAANFTQAEIRKAASTGLVIKEGSTGRGVAGYYSPRIEGSSVNVPMIVLRRPWSDDTLTHEFIHHLRFIDDSRIGITRTPFPLNKSGEWQYRGESTEFNSQRNMEEASTVAETTTRTRAPAMWPTGYYSRTSAHGNTDREKYDYDRKLLAGDKPPRGKRARKAVESKFQDTSIAHLRYYTPGQSALTYYKSVSSNTPGAGIAGGKSGKEPVAASRKSASGKMAAKKKTARKPASGRTSAKKKR